MTQWYDAFLHPFPYMHCCTIIQICSTSHQSNEKNHQLVPKCSTWSAHDIFVGLYFSVFPLFIYPSILSLFASILHVSICPSFHIQPSFYLQDLHLTLYHSMWLPRLYLFSHSLSLSLSRSLSLFLSSKSSYLYYL